MITDKNLLALVSLVYCPHLGPSSIRKLEKNFSNLEEVFIADNNKLIKAGIKLGVISKFFQWRKKFSNETLLIDLQKAEINFISWHDNNYPSLLKEISDPPPILFYRGQLVSNFPDQNKYLLAVIGARQCTSYAEKVIKNILPTTLTKRLTIISGLASGVDGLAHQQALSCQGRTIAVLGSGLDWRQLYPRSHRHLAEDIIRSGGCVLSEFPPHTPPNKINFPRRNRIISGLANCILVVEATPRSGSLITARAALEQGRDVLAVPGNIFWEKSMGTNQLIIAGARPILGADDLIDSLGIEISDFAVEIKTNFALKNDQLTPVEKTIYSIITNAYQCGEKLTTEKIILESKLDTATINSTLTILELKGLTKEVAGNFEPC